MKDSVVRAANRCKSGRFESKSDTNTWRVHCLGGDFCVRSVGVFNLKNAPERGGSGSVVLAESRSLARIVLASRELSKRCRRLSLFARARPLFGLIVGNR